MKVRVLRVFLIIIFSSMVCGSVALSQVIREEQERASRDSIVAPTPDSPTQAARDSEAQKPLMTLGIRPVGEDYKIVAIEAQKELKKLGYYTAAIDGIIGKESRRALMDFQRDLNVPITGQLDQETIQRLSKPTLILNTQDFPPFHYKIDIF